MKTRSIDELFRKVPAKQKDEFLAFRRRNPVKTVSISGVSWEYYCCGEGQQNLLLLAGGARFADVWFQLIAALEHDYRILAPSDPGVPSVQGFVNGISTILDIEHIDRTNVLGTSLGGLIAQCFVREQPRRVDRLILSNTLTPSAIPKRATAFALRIAGLFPLRMLQLSIKWNMLSIMSTSKANRDFWMAYWEEKTQTHLLRLSRDEAISQHKLAIDMATRCHFTSKDLCDWPGSVGLINSDNDIAYIRKDFPNLRELYPQARIITLHAAGHTPGYTQPSEYRDAVEKLLSN